jgi:hypothetical protein
MAVIYNNIPAIDAQTFDYVLSGHETKVLLLADYWGGGNIVTIEAYSSSDAAKRGYEIFYTDSGYDNEYWCIPCASKGDIYRFKVYEPEILTKELFVEII